MNTSIAIALAWAVTVLAVGWHWRPRAAVAVGPEMRSRSRRGSAGFALRAAETVGRPLRRLARRAPDPSADRRVGYIAAASLAAFVVARPLAAVPPMIGWAVPALRRRRLRRWHADHVADELPQIVDLLVLAAGSGLTAMLAVSVATDHSDGPVATALARARERVDLGADPEAAFAGVVSEVGDPARPMVAALVTSIREGSALVPALDRAGHEARMLRRRRAEEAARRVPVKLLFPLVLCTLPAFALLTIVPLLIAALGSLHA